MELIALALSLGAVVAVALILGAVLFALGELL